MSSDRLVTVFGGSGFVGRNIVRQLARQGYRIRVAVRRPDLAIHLQPLGGVGQIHAVQANVRYRDSVEAATSGAWGVINLVGILCEQGRQRFDAVQDFGARAIAEAAASAKAERIVHVSAIGADPNSDAKYARSKAAGETGVLKARSDATILRPSVIFGPGDDLFNRFAALLRIAPVFPVIGADTRFQPVFVGDVATAAVKTLEDGKGIYELGGPDIVSMRDMLETTLEITGRQRLLVPVPDALARLKAMFLQLLPNPVITVDQVRMLAVDNVVSEDAQTDGRTLEGLGISPANMQVILPTYLDRFRRTGQFEEFAR